MSQAFPKLTNYSSDGGSILHCPNCDCKYMQQQQVLVVNKGALKALFKCESCSHEAALSFELHKGMTIVQWEKQ